MRIVSAWPYYLTEDIGDTYVVGGLAEVTEGRDGEGDGLVDVLGELLGAAEGLGDVGGERRRHCGDAAEEAAVVWMGLGGGVNKRRYTGGRGGSRARAGGVFCAAGQPGEL